ncbi:MAG TPA: HAD family phosphatase [Candidatus Limnocylindrales bacterium]|nr:HAD family phosphatase [Candidatus Limnocylindrales bacterium]
MPPDPRLSSVAKALVLDLDGTLVDTVETRIHAWLAAFDEFGIPASRTQVAPLIGIDGRRLARDVATAAGHDLPPGGDEAIDLRSGEIYGELNRDPRPLPGARELLTWLDDAGLPWAIATSSRREQVGASLAALDLPRSPTIVDGTHVTHAKPAPDLLLLASRELDREPAGCWCVGDSTWDMEAATAAGMLPVGVTAGAAVSSAELRAAGAALVIETLTDLRDEVHQRMGSN